MTAFNREKFISDAISSVLASTWTNFELIIVDDGSSDQTLSIVNYWAGKDKRISVFVNEKNLGDYHNRNKAASYAKGKYLKYLDSDDLIYPHGLAVMIQAMESFPEAAVGIVGKYNQEEIPYPFEITPKEAYKRHFFKDGIFSTGPTGLIFRNDVFMQIGAFSGKRYVGDTEINLKIASKWPVVLMASSLVFWRKHEGQEFAHGNATTGYLERNLPMLIEVFRNIQVPLEEYEIAKILKLNRSQAARHLLKIAIKDRKPSEAYKLFRLLSLRLGDFKNAFF